MHIVTIASRKGGAGKSTFAVNLAVQAELSGEPALLVDTDPQGSLGVWHRLRGGRPPLVVPSRPDELRDVIATARPHTPWVFVDGPPQNNDDVAAMMRCATLVLIPTRPAVFDLASVAASVDMARRLRRPFFVALNCVPPKRGVTESPVATAARRAIRDMGAPLWRGAVAQRAAHVHALAAGETVSEQPGDLLAAAEMRQLWAAVRDTALAMAAYQKAG